MMILNQGIGSRAEGSAQGGSGQGDPTPDEIATACAQIRAAWSPRKKRRRAGLSKRAAVVPMLVTTAQRLDGRRPASPNFLEDL